MVTNIVYARRVFIWGLAIFAFGFGVPLAFYGFAGGGEMGVEAVAMLGLLPLILLGFWVGVPVMLFGLIAWLILKIHAQKLRKPKLP